MGGKGVPLGLRTCAIAKADALMIKSFTESLYSPLAAARGRTAITVRMSQ